MKPILVLRHIHFEGLGCIEEVLKSHRIPVHQVAVDEGQKVPADIADFSGMILMGGPMSANDPLPWLQKEFDLVLQADAGGLPVLGHCLGAQIISKALGGTVQKNPVKEIGWFEVTPPDSAAAKTFWGNLPSFEAFHWHGEMFSIPSGAALILSSRWCENQGFIKNNMWAFQCHMEVSAAELPVWTRAYAAEIEHPTLSIQSEADMLRDAAAKVAAMQPVARSMYEKWIALLSR